MKRRGHCLPQSETISMYLNARWMRQWQHKKKIKYFNYIYLVRFKINCCNHDVIFWDHVFVPFFPAWSSQFSKVQGPQAPHGDTSQSMGQGIWHSWDLLGIGPLHSLFSTGREAVQMIKKEHKISST